MATYQIRANDGVTAKIRLKGHKDSMTFYPMGGKSARSQAEKWAEAEEEKILDGNYTSPKRGRTTTLKQALDEHEKRAKTLKGYSAEKYRIQAWRDWKYSSNKLTELSEAKFNEYRDDRRQHVKDGTIRLDFAVITALFSHTNFGIANPAIRTIKTLGFAEKRSRRLAKNEQSYLLSALMDTKCSDPKRANKYLPLVVIFGTETACRLSEIVKDTKDHTSGVLWQNVKVNGDASTVQIFDTKNGKNRFVPLSPIAVEAIQAAGKLSNQEGAVFKTTASAIKQAWNRAKKRAVQQYQHDNKNGTIDPNFLINFRFHDLRHEAASRWKRHFSMAALQDLTGHSDIRSLSRYLNSDEDDIADMATRMAEIQRKAGLLPPP